MIMLIQLCAPLEDPSMVDLEIVNSLTLLGWGEEEEIIQNLTNQEYVSWLIYQTKYCQSILSTPEST